MAPEFTYPPCKGDDPAQRFFTAEEWVAREDALERLRLDDELGLRE